MLLIYLVSVFLCAYIGARAAQKADMPRWLGALIGAIFLVPGLVVLVLIDVAFAAMPPNRG
jgi:hypothetical protein